MDEMVVVGSMNMDLVVTADNFPETGETILGNSFTTTPGGKGANQAVTIGKLGGAVSFLSACGQDSYGRELLDNLEECGVNTDNIRELTGVSTGIADIFVGARGDNRIVVVPGANGRLDIDMIDRAADIIQGAKVMLVQLEIPAETVYHAIKLAHSSNTTVVLDPAPAQKLPAGLYQKIDYILPNEGEIKQLVEGGELSRSQRVQQLFEWGVKRVIVTEGEKGINYYSPEGVRRFSPLEVEVVDTTGAGDAFAGAFAYGLTRGWELEKTIKFAITVAGISVTRLGAQASLPALEEVETHGYY